MNFNDSLNALAWLFVKELWLLAQKHRATATKNKQIKLKYMMHQTMAQAK